MTQNKTAAELLHFLQMCKGHTYVMDDQWYFEIKNKGQLVTCKLERNHCVLYTATYGVQHALIEEERYYRAFVSSAYWNAIENSIDELILPFFKQARILYCQEIIEREQKEKPIIQSLKKQLRVVKERVR